MKMELLRLRLVEELRNESYSKTVLHAFASVPREQFVPEFLQSRAYENDALPIGYNQTISQPSTIARMLELLLVFPEQKVLEVGSGCGYASALLSKMVGEHGKIIGIELVKELAEQSKKNLKNAQVKNVEIVQGDGTKGFAKEAPFDRILVSAACPFIPKALFDQLHEKGIAIAPVGDPGFQVLTTLQKINGKPAKKEFVEENYVFVPLLGSYSKKNL